MRPPREASDCLPDEAAARRMGCLPDEAADQARVFNPNSVALSGSVRG